jgi:hypothetical protein
MRAGVEEQDERRVHHSHDVRIRDPLHLGHAVEGDEGCRDVAEDDPGRVCEELLRGGLLGARQVERAGKLVERERDFHRGDLVPEGAGEGFLLCVGGIGKAHVLDLDLLDGHGPVVSVRGDSGAEPDGAELRLGGARGEQGDGGAGVEAVRLEHVGLGLVDLDASGG